jgi:putative PIN family toxin of toxin-antitoxin system
MRAVLDTNEYISGFVFGGPPRQVLMRAEEGKYELVVSAHIREEVERVLADKFKWPVERIALAIDPLWEIAHFVTPQVSIAASRDETDNRILECAIESGAVVIVTNDNDLLVLNPFQGIFILKAHEFLAALDSGQSPRHGTAVVPA